MSAGSGRPAGFVATMHMRDHLLPLAAIGLSGAVRAVLFLYAFFENVVPL